MKHKACKNLVKMKISLGALCVLVLWCVQQIQDCRGQSLIGSSQPIVARVGDDVILPCFFQSPRDAAALTFEWLRPDLQPRSVFVWLNKEIKDVKNPQFENRTFLFQDTLKKGNISLKLTDVKPKDSGVYRCSIPALGEETSVRLIVGSSSPVVVSVALVDVWGSGVVLQCASGGWFPEPELWWLDSEGWLLSVEHSVSVSDGLYEVSSRVTVEQSGTFSCTVNQSSTNLSERSSVQVEDEAFRVKIFPVIIGLTVGLVVFAGAAIILLFLLYVTKQEPKTYEEPTFDNTSAKDELNTHVTRPEQENNFSLKNKLVKEMKRQREISERTSPVIIDHFDQYGRSVRLKKPHTGYKNLKDWSLHIEVDDGKALIYIFESSLRLIDPHKTVTIWAQGCCPPEADKCLNKEWENQGPWNTGEMAFVSLYDEKNKLKDRICERMKPHKSRTAITDFFV